MTPSDDPADDEAWRDIVERYADEADPGDVPAAEATATPASPGDEFSPAPEPTGYDPVPWNPVPWEDEGRFVPPAPEPIPMPPAPRLAAWLGLFGAPAILLVFLLANWSLPSWASTLLVVWFVAGFAFLVATMGSGPRDPGDDGAVV